MESTLIRELTEEHQVVEALLDSLERLALDDARNTKELVSLHLQILVELMDALHHGREEDILFEALQSIGLPLQQGPIAVLLSEHEDGRNLVQSLRRVASAEGPFNETERDCLKSKAKALRQLMTEHIERERVVFYPVALKHLAGNGVERIDALAAAWHANNPGKRDKALATAAEALRMNAAPS